jgi:hypothetical protein
VKAKPTDPYINETISGCEYVVIGKLQKELNDGSSLRWLDLLLS